MNRRDFLRALGLGAAGAAMPSVPAEAATPAEQQSPCERGTCNHGTGAGPAIEWVGRVPMAYWSTSGIATTSPHQTVWFTGVGSTKGALAKVAELVTLDIVGTNKLA